LENEIGKVVLSTVRTQLFKGGNAVGGPHQKGSRIITGQKKTPPLS